MAVTKVAGELKNLMLCYHGRRRTAAGRANTNRRKLLSACCCMAAFRRRINPLGVAAAYIYIRAIELARGIVTRMYSHQQQRSNKRPAAASRSIQQQAPSASPYIIMSGGGSGAGVWVFRNGVMQLEQPMAASRKALVYTPTGEVVRSVEALERRLASLGWERYYENRSVVQLHKRDGGADLITIPRDSASLRSVHMYDVVVKNRGHFKVVDA